MSSSVYARGGYQVLSPEKRDAVRYWNDCALSITRLTAERFEVPNVNTCEDKLLVSRSYRPKPKTVEKSEVFFITSADKGLVIDGYIINIKLMSGNWISIVAERDGNNMDLLPYLIDGRSPKP